MSEENKIKKTSLTLDSEKHKIFIKVCKLNNSDASKEVRKFIDTYLEKNKNLWKDSTN